MSHQSNTATSFFGEAFADAQKEARDKKRISLNSTRS